jgi:transposase
MVPAPVAMIALFVVGRLADRIMDGRRIATRYDKLAANYLAFVKLASIRIWLRANESAP